MMPPTVYVIFPITDKAKEWLNNNVDCETAFKGGIAVEHRYIGDIVSALLEEGFITNRDFRVVW